MSQAPPPKLCLRTLLWRAGASELDKVVAIFFFVPTTDSFFFLLFAEGLALDDLVHLVVVQVVMLVEELRQPANLSFLRLQQLTHSFKRFLQKVIKNED
jgi:hypothetical protein